MKFSFDSILKSDQNPTFFDCRLHCRLSIEMHSAAPDCYLWTRELLRFRQKLLKRISTAPSQRAREDPSWAEVGPKSDVFQLSIALSIVDCIDATEETGRYGRLLDHSRVSPNSMPKGIGKGESTPGGGARQPDLFAGLPEKPIWGSVGTKSAKSQRISLNHSLRGGTKSS